MTEARECPFCRSKQTEPAYTMKNNVCVKCSACGAKGRYAPTLDEAIVAWNTRPREDKLEHILRVFKDCLTMEIDGLEGKE